mmetsp:Transcript_48640/g.112709  ORF Transcript_48640/g.112709 Transcript_48640/m.112709 type:complete len:357 (+) Transcript_48640:915-1985(+)
MAHPQRRRCAHSRRGVQQVRHDLALQEDAPHKVAEIDQTATPTGADLSDDVQQDATAAAVALVIFRFPAECNQEVLVSPQVGLATPVNVQQSSECQKQLEGQQQPPEEPTCSREVPAVPTQPRKAFCTQELEPRARVVPRDGCEKREVPCITHYGARCKVFNADLQTIRDPNTLELVPIGAEHVPHRANRPFGQCNLDWLREVLDDDQLTIGFVEVNTHRSFDIHCAVFASHGGSRLGVEGGDHHYDVVHADIGKNGGWNANLHVGALHGHCLATVVAAAEPDSDDREALIFGDEAALAASHHLCQHLRFFAPCPFDKLARWRVSSGSGGSHGCAGHRGGGGQGHGGGGQGRGGGR